MVRRRLTPLLLLQLFFMGGMAQTSLPSVFYRGTEYTKVITTAYGIPFLYDDVRGARKVQVLDQWYEGMDLHYDAEDDALVTLSPSGDIRLQLVREKVNAFVLGDKQFRRIGDDGFFEQLHDGAHAVYVKWQKVLVRKGVEDPYYRLYSKVYVKHAGGLDEVTSRSDLLRYFGSNKKSASEFIHRQNLNLRKDFAGSAAALMRFADANGYHE